jgi:serine/threonine protein kinase
MSGGSEQRDLMQALSEELLDQKRHGKEPNLQAYVNRYPELADRIRDLFRSLSDAPQPATTLGDTTSALGDSPCDVAGMQMRKLGDYRLLREIGRGGMGVVYEAEQESLGRRVALKVLSSTALADSRQVRRFEREAKAAARLHHTNIVPVFGVGEQDGQNYYVMQYIAGVGLDVLLREVRRVRQAKSNPPTRPAGVDPIHEQGSSGPVTLEGLEQRGVNTVAVARS